MTLRMRLARFILGCFGWGVVGGIPDEPKYVLVVAPHTSNWDFPLGILGKAALGLRLRWMGKHTLFKPPFGFIMRGLGGIAVDRRARNNVIQQVAAVYAQNERLVVAITPEGTRSYTEGWKSGFYYIAREAGVPLALAYIDYGGKRIGVSDTFVPSGDLEADLDRIRAFFADKKARYPAKVSPIRPLPREVARAAARAEESQGSVS